MISLTNHILLKNFITMISPLYGSIKCNNIYHLSFTNNNINALFSHNNITQRFNDDFIISSNSLLYLSLKLNDEYYFIEEIYHKHTGHTYFNDYSIIIKSLNNNNHIITEGLKIYILDFLKKNLDLDNYYQFYNRL
jgi:hypothetical protein